MQEVLNKAVADAKEMVSKNLVPLGKMMTLKIVQEAINILKGAVTIVYPMKLPPHDVIRMEFENIEDLSGTQASLEVIDPATAQLWFCGKEMFRDKIVADYVGKVENCKVGELPSAFLKVVWVTINQKILFSTNNNMIVDFHLIWLEILNFSQLILKLFYFLRFDNVMKKCIPNTK